MLEHVARCPICGQRCRTQTGASHLKIRSHKGSRAKLHTRSVMALMVVGVSLGGCSVPFADLPVVGLPANTPTRPATQAEYPAVHDLPAPRRDAVLAPEEQAKIEKDLIAARNRQANGSQKASRQN